MAIGYSNTHDSVAPTFVRPPSRRSRNRRTSEAYASSPAVHSDYTSTYEMTDYKLPYIPLYSTQPTTEDEKDEDVQVGSSMEVCSLSNPLSVHGTSFPQYPEDSNEKEKASSRHHVLQHMEDMGKYGRPAGGLEVESESDEASILEQEKPQYGRRGPNDMFAQSTCNESQISPVIEIGRDRTQVAPAFRTRTVAFDDNMVQTSAYITKPEDVLIHLYQTETDSTSTWTTKSFSRQQSVYNPSRYYLRSRERVRYNSSDSESPSHSVMHLFEDSSDESFVAVQDKKLSEKFRRKSVTIYAPTVSEQASTLDGRRSVASPKPQDSRRAGSVVVVPPLRAHSALGSRLSYRSSHSKHFKPMPIKHIPSRPSLCRKALRILLIFISALIICGVYLGYAHHTAEITLNPTIATANQYGAQLIKIREHMGTEDIEVERCVRDLTWLLRQVVVQAIMLRARITVTAMGWLKELPYDWNRWDKPNQLDIELHPEQDYNLDMFRRDGTRCLKIIDRRARYDFEGEGEEMVEMLKDIWDQTITPAEDATMEGLCKRFFIHTMRRLEKPLGLIKKEKGVLKPQCLLGKEE